MFAISTIWLFGRSFFGGSIMAGLKRFGFAVLTLVTTVMILPQPSSEQLAESKAAQAKLGRSLDAAFNASTGRSGAIKGK
jgi:hypothetical protein